MSHVILRSALTAANDLNGDDGDVLAAFFIY